MVDFWDPTIWRCDDYSQWTVLTMTSGSVPNYVKSWGFYYYWTATKINGQTLGTPFNIGQTGGHNYYILLTTPQAPMEVPWTDVLDYSCVWAGSQSTDATAITKVVQHLYDDSDFLYDTEGGSPKYTDDGGPGTFDLTTFLSEFGSSQDVNCYDMGKAVKIFANAIGCNAIYEYSNPFGYLNCIKPIGKSWANNPFYDAGGGISDDPIVGEDDDSCIPAVT